MSLAIDDPIRGEVKIKTFDEETLKDQKRRHSLEKVSAFVSSCIIDSCQIIGEGEKKRQVCRAIIEAIGFYRGLDMQETVNLCQISEFSLDLHQPLPAKLNETASQIHPHNKSNRP